MKYYEDILIDFLQDEIKIPEERLIAIYEYLFDEKIDMTECQFGKITFLIKYEIKEGINMEAPRIWTILKNFEERVLCHYDQTIADVTEREIEEMYKLPKEITMFIDYEGIADFKVRNGWECLEIDCSTYEYIGK